MKTLADHPSLDALITTRADLVRAIALADLILVQPRFGASLRWVCISKAEARRWAASLPDEATPDSVGCHGGTFASMAGDHLYIGGSNA